jgi:hypothetical protein
MRIPTPPLPPPSKPRFKLLAAAIILVALVWLGRAYTSTPAYKAGQALRQADAALKASAPFKAALLYRQVLAMETAQLPQARQGLQQALDLCLKDSTPEVAANALRLLADLPPALNSPQPLVPDAVQRGLALVDKLRVSDPNAALDILRQTSRLGGPDAASRQRPLEIDLLKAVIAAHPDRLDRVGELAALYEARQQWQECEQLLTPYGSRLGSTEGARILGMRLLERGDSRNAIALLMPYVEAQLLTLHRLEGECDKAFERAAYRAQQFLSAGQASAFQQEYNSASPARQKELKDAFIQSYQRKDPDCIQTLAAVTEANQVVPIALDLGIAQLDYARHLSDPEQRQAGMEAAERSFRVLRGRAENTDEYRLFLGQTYYWLGRSSEGQQLFDAFLLAHQRGYTQLIQLANVLRDLGDYSRARELAEEALAKAASPKDRFAAALLRAHTPRDISDRIAWLEKCDPSSPVSRIDLNSARGTQALQAGNHPLAATCLRKALADYAALPQEAAVLNNSGLISLDLYQATGDPEDYNHGLDLLEKSMALSPGNSMLIRNLTAFWANRACMDVASNALRLDLLKETSVRDTLPCLYTDEAGHEQLLGRLRQDPHMAKALFYLDKALLLAPRDANMAQSSLDLLSLLQDSTGLQKLAQQINTTAPNLSEVLADTRAAYDPQNNPDRLQRTTALMEHYQALIRDPAVQAHPLTLQYAQLQLASARRSSARYGAAPDSQALLDEAISLHRQAPSAATAANLLAAHFFRANDQLKRLSPAYAQVEAQTRLAFPPEYLIASLLERNPAAAVLIRTNTEVLQAIELLKTSLRTLPSSLRLCDWAILRALDPAAAAQAAALLGKDQPRRMAEALRLQLNPLSAIMTLNHYWFLLMSGDTEAARQHWERAVQNGVPLPSMPTP